MLAMLLIAPHTHTYLRHPVPVWHIQNAQRKVNIEAEVSLAAHRSNKTSPQPELDIARDHLDRQGLYSSVSFRFWSGGLLSPFLYISSASRD